MCPLIREMREKTDRMKGQQMLKSILRYIILGAMMIIIAHMLALSQKTTWEVPTKVIDSICDLGYKLTILTCAEIILFILDFKAFKRYSVFRRIIYLIPVLVSLIFSGIYLFGNVGLFFEYHAEILTTANIWGSVIGAVWAGMLMLKRGCIRKSEK